MENYALLKDIVFIMNMIPWILGNYHFWALKKIFFMHYSDNIYHTFVQNNLGLVKGAYSLIAGLEIFLLPLLPIFLNLF